MNKCYLDTGTRNEDLDIVIGYRMHNKAYVPKKQSKTTFAFNI